MTTTSFDWPDRCLGTMFFGTRVERPAAFALLDRWAHAGGGLLDTANNYAQWQPGGTGDESETVLGEWLAAHGNRDEMQLATKVGARARPGTEGLRGIEGLGADAVDTQVRGSLQRLRTDRLDVCYAHVDDRAVPLTETLGAFNSLVKDGTISTVACSNYEGARLRVALAASERQGFVRYTANQLRASYLQPRADADHGVQVMLTDDLHAVCNETGTRVLGYSGLLAGAYTHHDRVPPTYRHEGTDAQLAAVDAVARRLDVTANQVVLAWLRRRGVVPVLGVSTTDQLAESLGAYDVVLDDDAVEQLAAALR